MRKDHADIRGIEVNGMRDKIKQYKNLIVLVMGLILVIVITAADPLGFFAERRHQRAAIRNQIAIEKAETEKQIALIKAEKDAGLLRIQRGGTVRSDVFDNAASDESNVADAVIEDTEKPE